MSIARALTKRIRREADVASPARSHTVKYSSGTIRRDMISLPTELISTTNVQALTAPDIRSNSSSTTSSSSDSVNSNQDSDFSTIDRSFLSGQDSSDNSSVDIESPATPSTPPMDGSKSFFDAKNIMPEPVTVALEGVPDLPAVPARAPSHSKAAHVELSRKRSVQRMSPPPNTIESATIRNSADIFGPSSNAGHPFSRELAKVTEIAEGFGAASTVLEEEEQDMQNKGLHKFTVEEYIYEIAALYGGVLDGQLGPMANPWM